MALPYGIKTFVWQVKKLCWSARSSSSEVFFYHFRLIGQKCSWLFHFCSSRVTLTKDLHANKYPLCLMLPHFNLVRVHGCCQRNDFTVVQQIMIWLISYLKQNFIVLLSSKAVKYDLVLIATSLSPLRSAYIGVNRYTQRLSYYSLFFGEWDVN